jgi:hypothetical protein
MNSILERINTVCKNVRGALAGPVNFKKVIGSVRREFRHAELDISIKTKKDKTLNLHHFYVEAFYDAEEDFNNETPIEVYIYHNFDDTDLFEHRQLTELLIQIFDAVSHEYRHQNQSSQRGYAVFSDHAIEPFSKYLADPDELDAYAYSITIELLRVMTKERAKKYMTRMTVLSKLKSGQAFVSPNLNAYVSYFKGNPLLKQLAKKVYKHLETVDKKHIFQ